MDVLLDQPSSRVLDSDFNVARILVVVSSAGPSGEESCVVGEEIQDGSLMGFEKICVRRRGRLMV